MGRFNVRVRSSLTAIARWLEAIPHDVRWLRLLVAVNVLGSVYGFNWYAQQLASTPYWLWPVVPDSPLASLSFGIYLALRLVGRRPAILAAYAQLATFKYGLWSVIVLGGYMLRAVTLDGELLLLVATHAGMALEAWLLMRADPLPALPLAAAFAWLVVNDTFDYAVGTHPRVPDPQALWAVAAEALALSWLALAAAFRARRLAGHR